MTGITTSSSTSEIWSAISRNISTAIWPFSAARTSKPYWDSTASVVRRTIGSSSTTRIVPWPREWSSSGERAAKGACAAAAGNNTRNLLPLPGAVDTSMPPPCARTIPSTAASPSPLPGDLVVKNGSKMCGLVLLHSAAIVLDFEIHVAARRNPLRANRLSDVGRIHLFDAGRDRHGSARVANRFGAIGDQIERHLPDLRRVALQQRNFPIEIHVELDFFRNRGLRQTGQIFDQPGQINGMRDERTGLSGEGQKLSRNRRRPLAGAHDVLEHPPGGIARRRSFRAPVRRSP